MGDGEVSLLSLHAALAPGPELIPTQWAGGHRLRSPSPYVDALGCAVQHFLADGIAVSMADLCSINIATVLFPSKSHFAQTLTAVPYSVPCSRLSSYNPCNLTHP